MYSQFLNKYFIWKKRQYENQFRSFSHSQNKVLKSLIENNKSTDYLIQNGIQDTKSFYKKCPLVTYDDIEGKILRILNHGENQLSNEKTIAFSKSSGTTSRSKLIPLSNKTMDANFNASKSLLGQYIHSKPNSKILEGKNYALTGSFEKKNGYSIGDISALFSIYLNPIYRPFRVPRSNIATIPDWNQKMEKTVPILAESDIRWIAGVPSWMTKVIEKVEEYGQKPIAKVWGNLEVYFYGGINIEPFKSFFENKFQGKLNLWQTYNASEGFFGIQMSIEEHAMALMPNSGTYYECIPIQEIDKPQPSILELDELELDQTYELVISNSSGLYRYRIGDVIRIVNLLPLRFEIVGRTKNYINTFGEELMVINTERAIAKLNNEIKFSITDYSVAPVIEQNSGYHNWMIEFKQEPTDLKYFQERLDTILRQINSDYNAKRFNNIVLRPLRVESLRSNTITKWLNEQNRLNVQSKIPKLWNDCSIQKELRMLSLN